MLAVHGTTVASYEGMRTAGEQTLPGNHEYWILGLPWNDRIDSIFLESGFVKVTLDESYMILSGNVQEWQAAVSNMLRGDNVARKLGTLLITSVPKLFKGLNTQIKHDGTLCLR